MIRTVIHVCMIVSACFIFAAVSPHACAQSDVSYTLELSDYWLTPGDSFSVTGISVNHEPQPVEVIKAVGFIYADLIFYWPNWSDEFTFRIVELPPNEQVSETYFSL